MATLSVLEVEGLKKKINSCFAYQDMGREGKSVPAPTI